MSHEIETLIDHSDQELFREIGRTIGAKKFGAGSLSEDDLEEDGRDWLTRHRAEVAKAVCGSHAVKLYLESERAKDRVLLVASIADLIISLIGGTGGIAVAVLVVREGLETLCQKMKGVGNLDGD